MYYLCVVKREDMHRVRILSFVMLIFNALQAKKCTYSTAGMYI